MWSFLVLLVIIVLLFLNGFFLVRQQEAIIIERLGRFHRIVEAGFRFKIRNVKIDGQEAARSEQIPITGWNSWNTGLVPEFTHEAGTEVTVGIYVKCRGAGSGAWGKIDDALLNSVQ